MTCPDALSKDEPLVWSTGKGTDVWDMFRAASEGDLDGVRRLIESDATLVRSTYEYRSALSFAVRENRIDVARYLLERGADPVNSGTSDTLLEIALHRGYEEMQRLLEKHISDGFSSFGETIAEAIRERNIEKVRALLSESPELVHARDRRTNQPIHWAAMTRQLNMIDELVDYGADPDAKRADGARPIQLANGDYTYRGWRDVPKDTETTPREVIAHLRARGAYCDICTASYIGDIERVRELLSDDPSLANRPSEYVTYYVCSGTPLRNASAAGHIEIARLLLEHGADPNLPEEGIAPRGHALHSAVVGGHMDIVLLLLEHGAYPNVNIESSADTLTAAMARGDLPLVELLCSHGAARDVHLLAYYGDVQTAAAIFNANPALADNTEALENAAAEGQELFVRLMLRYKPDLPSRVGLGAKSRGLTELLFRHGMNANFRNWLGISPLHRIAQKGDVDAADLFIEHGADVNSIDDELRTTPLGYAARAGQAEMVELLLKRGANPYLPESPEWARPMALAQRHGHEHIARMLQQASSSFLTS